MTEKEMWSRFCAEANLDPETPHEAWAFCGGGPFADELAALVLAETKTATASALVAFETEGGPLPEPGCYSVILYEDGSAAGVIRDTKVSLVPFHEVTAEHAYQEGEGTRTLAEWREIHRRAFTPDYQAVGKEFDESGICVLEEFELLYPAIRNAQMNRKPPETHRGRGKYCTYFDGSLDKAANIKQFPAALYMLCLLGRRLISQRINKKESKSNIAGKSQRDQRQQYETNDAQLRPFPQIPKDQHNACQSQCQQKNGGSQRHTLVSFL